MVRERAGEKHEWWGGKIHSLVTIFSPSYKSAWFPACLAPCDRMVSGSFTARLLESRVPAVVGNHRSGLLLPEISVYKFSIIIYHLGFLWHQAHHSTVNSIDKMGLSTGAILRFGASC